MTGSTSLTPGQWYHIAAVYDGATEKLYVNGVLDGSQSYSAPIATDTNSLIIGGYYASPYLYNGRLDELSLYNRALSGTELLSIFSARGGGKCVNDPPSVSSAGNVTVGEGATATNTGSWNDPNSGDIVTLTASCGLITKNANGTWSWLFNTADGPDDSRTVTITATDDHGASSQTMFNLIVNNVAPSVANNGNITANEGSTATNSGTWSDPGLDVVTLAASVGSVTKNANGTWSWSFNTTDGPDETQDVTITATDSDGASSTTTFHLTVNNVAPSVANNGNVTANEGSTVTNTGIWSDPGLDIVTLAASVGSVTKNANGTWSWSFNTSDGPDETQDVTITATDSDGASSTTTFHLTVNNVAPSVARNNATVTVNEGSTATNTGTWSDPGLDVVTLAASVGSVTKNANGTWSWSLATINSTASQTVTISATDSDNAVSTTTFQLVVNHVGNNVAPVITAISNSSPTCGGVLQGERVTVSASFTDANAGDTHTASINWGDGITTVGTVTESNGSGSVAGNHIYATGGFYTVTVSVSDGGLSDLKVTSDVISGVGLHGGVLYIVGTDGKDVVHVNATCGNQLIVHAKFDVGRRDRGSCNEDTEDGDWDDDDSDHDSHRGDHRYRFNVADVTRIEMRLCDGDDVGHVTRRVLISSLIDGEAGDDKLRGGGGNDTVLGGTGNDKLWAATGNDRIDGGDGNDKLFGGQGSDTLIGGKGDDEIRADGGADSIFGDDGNDVIFAGKGNDTIYGGAGDDDIHDGCGGNGSDVINGGSGNDTVNAGAGNDDVDGGNGDDNIDLGAGNDVADGGSGNDTILGGDGNDCVTLGNGDDQFLGGNGNDVAFGGAGDDYMDLGAGNDSAEGGNGNDILVGRDGNDTLVGDQGRDLLIGGKGADSISGNADEDVLIAGDTSYDGNQAALFAIMAEWSSNKTYAVRVSNLLNGTGLTGGKKLDGNDGAIDLIMDKAGNESANDIDL